MNGINIPKNIQDKLEYSLVHAEGSRPFHERLTNKINSLKENNYLILNVDIKQPMFFGNSVWH